MSKAIRPNGQHDSNAVDALIRLFRSLPRESQERIAAALRREPVTC